MTFLAPFPEPGRLPAVFLPPRRLRVGLTGPVNRTAGRNTPAMALIHGQDWGQGLPPPQTQ